MLYPRELVWFRHADGFWKLELALVAGGHPTLAVITPSAAAALGFLDSDGAVLPRLRTQSSVSPAKNAQGIARLKFSLCGVEIQCPAVVKTAADIAAAFPNPLPIRAGDGDCFIMLPTSHYTRVVHTRGLKLSKTLL